MSKRKHPRERVKARQQKKQQRQMIIAASIIGVLILGIVAYFITRPPTPPDVSRDRLELDPILGNPDAEVTIVEYGAYSCHSCQVLHESGTLERVIDAYGGRVNLIFRDFPFITPTYDHMAAEVAQCVLDQGQDAFWQFHDLLYTEFYANQSRAQLVDIAAERTGINHEELNSCVNSLTHYQTVQYDAQRGINLGIRGTPTIFINGQRVNPSEANLRGAIDAALRG